MGPYGPTALRFNDAEIRDLTKTAMLVYRALTGNSAGIKQEGLEGGDKRDEFSFLLFFDFIINLNLL